MGGNPLKQSMQKFRHVTAPSALGGSPVGSFSRGQSSDAKPVLKVVPTSKVKATEIARRLKMHTIRGQSSTWHPSRQRERTFY